MTNKGVLSSEFNMSLGFIPIISSILLSEFIEQDTAIYIGTSIGIGGVWYLQKRNGVRVPNFILYLSTFVLLLISLMTAIPYDFIPKGMLSITLEISIIAPLLILYIHKRRFIRYFIKQKDTCSKRLFAQGAESAIVSARISLILASIHFIVFNLALFFQPLGSTSRLILYSIFPVSIFIISILLNQFIIRYFNNLMKHTEYVPIVNTHGDVIGKGLAINALNLKNNYINPVIRVAISTHCMLFLCSRPTTAVLDKGKIDVPMECYLRYGESLIEGVNRLIKNCFPEVEGLEPRFNLMYHFENEITNRLIYLFTIDVDDESILCTPHFKNSKLWNFKQIEENLGKGYFSSCFEEEYEQLKELICIREKYKEF